MVEKIYNLFNKPLKKYQKKLKKIDKEYELIKDIDFEIDKENLEKESIYKLLAIIKKETLKLYGISIHDVQMLGAMVLLDGNIIEMKTGEGKTLTSIIASIVYSIKNPTKKVHIVSVNDYLVKRDYEDYKDLVEIFKISHTFINESVPDWARRVEYEKQIIHITNSELGFDYLRDNMVSDEIEIRNKHFDLIIVDEADSVMIDEARNPLVISGEAEVDNRDLIKKINDLIIPNLKENKHFNVEKKDGLVLLTDEGIEKIQELLEIDNLYTHEHLKEIHYIDQCLNAHYLQELELQYLIKDGKVFLIDASTGRVSEGRRLSNGLHQAIEAKEGLEIEPESQTLASITYQNLIRKYETISGMTGTAETEKEEFQIIYGSEVVVIPPNVPVKRKDLLDKIYITEEYKFNAIFNKIKEITETGQPLLIGTASVDKSELLSNYLTKKGIKHSLLNAKNHEKEAEIISEAGKKGTVTIATNMAGRGVDIKINDEVRNLGGLYVLGTERHESRRIDNQLRGRAGRQGDNGVSEFYISLEDRLVQIFGGDKLKNFVSKISNDSDEPIESKLISRAIEKAQKKIEQMHFEARKQNIEYDDVINKQRTLVYDFRMKLITNEINIIDKLKEINNEIILKDLYKLDIDFNELETEENKNKIIDFIKEKLHLNISDFNFNENSTLEELNDFIIEKLENVSIEKFKEISEEDLISIYKREYVSILDKEWRKLLDLLDSLKTGVRLRAYNQKDPLSEFKRESHEMFLDFIETVKREAVYRLNLLYIKNKEENKKENNIEETPLLIKNINELIIEKKTLIKNINELNFKDKKEEKSIEELRKEKLDFLKAYNSNY